MVSALWNAPDLKLNVVSKRLVIKGHFNKDIEKKSPVRRQDRRWGLISSGGVQYQKTYVSVQRKLY